MKTLLEFFDQSADRFFANTFLWENKGNGYIGMTYGETKDQVCRFAAGLISMGIKHGDRIALLSEARNDWVICELGILYTGAVNVPLSVRMNEPAEIIFRLNHSGARMIIVSASQVNKIRNIRADLPLLEKIIILDETPVFSADEVLSLSVLKSGDQFLADHQDVFRERTASVSPDDHANISYTSGTTADPKGIILTHRNYVANIGQAYSLMDISENFTTLLILPWDHAFAHTAGIYCFMGKGASIASVQAGRSPMETLKNMPKNIREIRPNLLFTVPAIAKNFRKNIEKTIRTKGKFSEMLFHLALRVAFVYNGKGIDRGKGIRFLLWPLIRIFDVLIFKQIRKGFGGRLEFFIGGGALLDIELQRFFYAIGIPMLQGYGLTEAAPLISSNSIKKHILGSSGYLVKNLELKICDEQGKIVPDGEKGEIVVRGENVMAGYWLNEEATHDSIRDGWLHTGDLGYLDHTGFLYVFGRFKSLLIADDGEKYSPEGMEEAFASQSVYIEQCMLYNNQNPYTIALLVPNKEALLLYLAGRDLDPGSEEGLKSALEKINQELLDYRSGNHFGTLFPQRWLPSAIAILEEGFTEENHQLNFQLKIVRGKVVEHYQEMIRFLYSPAGKDIFNEKNAATMKKLLS
jgi:long-chain acyl-CoA synthetase